MHKAASVRVLAAVLIALTGLFAVVPLMGAMSSTEAVTVLDPTDIVNISGRRNSFVGHTIYTVPTGETLVIQSVVVTAYNDIAGQPLPATLNLKCDDAILVPREIMVTSINGFLALDVNLGELGLVCPPGGEVKLTGGPVLNADTIGWMLMGQLVATP